MVKIEDTDLNYYEVGGSVRDRLLDEDPDDEDFVIVGHTVEEVVETLGEDSKVVGEDFPVFLDEAGKECAMARTEENAGDGHNEFEIHTSPEVTIEEDLSRRDLTINALARDPEKGHIIDPFKGQQDLNTQTLQHTTHAFVEDPLRVLRVARFAATLPDTVEYESEGDYDNGWTVDEHTKALCRRTSHKIQFMSEERIAEELLKVFKRSEKPSKFFRVLHDLGALNVAFPEIESLRRVPAGPREHHAEGTAFEHTMRVLDHAPDTLRCRLAALAHDLGKTRTPVEDLPSHYGHDAEGVPIAERMANRLRLSNEYKGVMMDAAEQHMRFTKLPEMSEGKVIDLVERLDRSPTHINPEELLALMDADGMGRQPQTPVTDRQHSTFPWLIMAARTVIDNIGGEEVLQLHEDKEPGEWVGDRINQLRIETLRDARNAGEMSMQIRARLYFKSPGDVRDSIRQDLWNPPEGFGRTHITEPVTRIRS